MCVCVRERERERDRERERERERERQTDRQIDRGEGRGRQTDKVTGRQTDRHRHAQTYRQTHSDRQRAEGRAVGQGLCSPKLDKHLSNLNLFSPFLITSIILLCAVHRLIHAAKVLPRFGLYGIVRDYYSITIIIMLKWSNLRSFVFNTAKFVHVYRVIYL